MRHKALHRNGFTLIELTIAISIATLVAGASLAAWFQLATTRARSSDYMTAYSQVQNAGYWFSRDAVQITDHPAIVNPAPAQLQSLTLQWSDDEDVEPEHIVVYTFDVDLRELTRTPTLGGGTSMVVAQYVTSVKCDWTDPVTKDTLFLEITAQVGEPTVRTATRTYKVEPRVSIP